MARVKLTIDHEGVAEVLHSPKLNAAVTEAAERIAAHTRTMLEDSGASQGRGRKRQAPPEVDVQQHTTDREHDTVMIHGAASMTYQTRDGVLTRATGMAGLRFRKPANTAEGDA